MRKFFIALAASASLVLPTIAPAVAGGLKGLPDNFLYQSQGSEVAAMAYFKIPFTGRLKTRESPVRFGFSLQGRSANFSHNYTYSGYHRTFAMDGSINLLDLSWGPKAKQSFKLNGYSFEELNALYADGDNDKDGMSNGTKIALGVGAAAVAIIIAAVIVSCSNDTSFDGCD